MIRFLLLMISLQFALTACKNEKQKNISVNDSKIKEVETEQSEESEYTYSDSMVEQLISNSRSKPKLVIDTIATLMNASCQNLNNVYTFALNESDIDNSDSELTAVSEELKALLNVTHCFSRIDENENYSTNVYYNQQYESHYSASLELIVINKQNYNISKLILARSYGNEQGDEIISSTMDKNNVITRKIVHNYRYIHGVGEVDSSSVNIEHFFIDKHGEIIQKN